MFTYLEFKSVKAIWHIFLLKANSICIQGAKLTFFFWLISIKYGIDINFAMTFQGPISASLFTQ